ncbi:MAG: extracellular solute-binding protein [Thermoanaerobacterium sp.]|nr:extracellular solute-binding protein [Thermoanaerobacterium sp.]
MKRILRMSCLIVALVLLVSVMASCGLYSDETPKQNKENSSTTGENSGQVPELASKWPEFAKHHAETVTFFEQGWTGPVEGQDIIAPEIERRTNFRILYEPMTVPTGDDYTQKLNLMVASNEVPNIFFGGNDTYTRTIYEKLGQSGQIWDIGEIIKDYKNLYDLVRPELILYKTKDGKNYFIPTQTGRGYEVLNEPPHGLYVRKDFLDKLGMDYPRTPEELKEYLRRCVSEIKVNGQPVIGLVLGENLSGLEQLYEPFLPLIGQHETYTLPFDPNDNWKVKNYEYSASPELMQAAKYIFSLKKEGLLDKEVLTIKHAQFQEKVSSGLASAITAAWWDMNTFSDNAKEVVPELMYVAPPQIYASEEIKESRLRDWTNWVGCWSSVIISKKVDEETLRHFLAMMDYLATEEGQLLVQAGIEGKTYTWNEEGKYVFTPEFIEKTNNLDWNKAAAYGVFYYAQLVCNIPAISDKQTTPPALLREDNRLSWENRKEIRDHYKPDMDPPKDYYFLPGEVETQKFPAIKDAKLEFWAKVLSANSEEEVEKLVIEWGKTCKEMGIDEIIAERQTYIDNFKLTE